MAFRDIAQTFIYGDKGQMLTPEQVAQRRAEIAAREAKTIPGLGHWAASLNQGLTGFLDGRDRRNANQAESEGMARGRATMARARATIADLLAGGAGGGFAAPIGGGSSGTWTPAAPTADQMYPTGVDAMPANEQSNGYDMGREAPPMTPQEMIIAGAKARGLDPIDVATAISYETGGTFDPMQRGPTTQWGQHQGLIQFGGPQREQYGVDMSSPEAALNSQLNPETGAVWSYLDSTGVKPGMGLDNIYSAINAGAPGRFNASDANNGGAPGTVADKVAGMGDHRAKAAEYLGGTWTPNPSGVTMSTSGGAAPQGGGNDIAALLAAAADPWAVKQYGPVIDALLGQQISRQNSQYEAQLKQADPMYQAQLAQLTAPKPVDPFAGTQVINGQLVTMQGGHPQILGDFNTPDPGYRTMTPDEVATVPGLDPTKAYQVGPNNEIKPIGGGGQTINVGGSEIGTIPPGFEVFTDAKTGARSMRPIAGGPAAADQAKVDAAAANKGGNAAIASDVVTNAAKSAREANKRRTFTGLAGKAASYDPSTENAEVYRQVDVLKSNASVENINAMRAASPTGAALGAASDKDIALLASKSGALDPASPYFERDLDDYERTLLRIIHGDKSGDEVYNQTRGDAGDDPPAGVTAEEWGAMSPEDKALFK